MNYLFGISCTMGFPGGWDGKESAYNAGDLGSIPGSGRCAREGDGHPLQCSCLENSTDRGAWCGLLYYMKSRLEWRGHLVV